MLKERLNYMFFLSLQKIILQYYFNKKRRLQHIQPKMQVKCITGVCVRKLIKVTFYFSGYCDVCSILYVFNFVIFVNYLILNKYLLTTNFCNFMFFFRKRIPIIVFTSVPSKSGKFPMITFSFLHTGLLAIFKAQPAPGSGLCLISMFFSDIATWLALHFLLGNTQRPCIRENSLTILYKQHLYLHQSSQIKYRTLGYI